VASCVAAAGIAAASVSIDLPDCLTAGEKRLVSLVACGQSNQEVAARLDLSPKTVEWTLTRVYRKLGVHSRAELIAHLAGFDDSS
jgi:DNA-binding CsgD family transcriptional regulator